MGVPAFYRWLVKKYPSTVANAIEEEGDEAGGGSSSVVDSRSSRPNPNGLEFDNLYLDMNGIIHPCFHPVDHEAEERKLRTEFEMAGKPVLPKQESEVSDSNIITPGTEFMDELSKDLKLYINQHLETDAGWKKIKVILSDSNVPGEGEQKIMSFIRLQRASPGYDPNTRHCLYGLDADLIMLALATHELHFSILRENVLIQEQQPHLAIEASLNKAEPSSLTCRGPLKQRNSAPMKQHYQFLHIWILREYLELDLTISEHPSHVKIDLERLIDDFIFMCLFTGNDFLPHMPTLEIHEAGYEKERFVSLKRVEKFILSVGAYEERIFKKRSEIQDRWLKKLLAQYSDDKEEEQQELQHCAAKGTTQSTNTSEVDFQLDEEGKRFTWQDDEAERNSTKVDMLFVRSSEERLGSQIFSLYRKQHEGGETDTAKEPIGADLGCGLSGFISPCNEYPWECDEGGRANNILFVMYELPNACQHIPRLLQGVNIPEKTITEGDIVETQLWHDTSSSRGLTTASSSSWDPRGRNPYPVTYGGACNLDENWKSSCSAQFEDLRISGSRQGFKSFERGRTANFQSYGNSLVADRSGYEWRQSSYGQLLGAPLGQGGRQISGSVQGTSAGIPSHHAWQHNLSPPPAPSMQGQGWRQSGWSVQGTSAGRTSHHAWQHNLSPPPAPSMQGQGWRQVVQGHNWQHNVRPPNAPSMQGYGWRQSGGNVRGMSARSTTSQQARRHNPAPPSAPSMQAHGRGQFTSSAAPRDWEVRDTP
ncbi:hypothetical protein RHMOL_Rhmol13G0296500 [Rhododendron molle]|uniref:Uncharacterized protein n=1 Tax=Rhododendron molle TaxID=49168 RepID=A0ACC0LD82_RHOML|nr:hypothetical protein RHMOL_Rhmol13G0296500 [Rhododendron molle]